MIVVSGILIVVVTLILGYNMCIRDHWFDYEYEEEDEK